MKTGNPTLEELQCLPPAIHYFINVINEVCKRGGMGTKLQKNHLYLDLPKYISMLGPPKGWNSAPNESHHKTEVKAPACTTQKDAKSIIQ